MLTLTLLVLHFRTLFLELEMAKSIQETRFENLIFTELVMIFGSDHKESFEAKLHVHGSVHHQS
jgi:hypothetical protein